MRRRDDDLSPFRDDPVVKALTAPATEVELQDEGLAVEAFKAAIPPNATRRSVARIATTTTAAVVTLAISGGAAAAYTAHLPASWQAKLHKDLPALDIPAPHHHHDNGGISAAPSVTPAPVPTTSPTPAGVPTAAGSPTPHSSPTSVATSPMASPAATPSLPVVVTTAPATPTSSPTSTGSPRPAVGGQLTMTVSPGTRVTVGTQLTVDGRMVAADGSPGAGRQVVLLQRLFGERRWQRVGGPLQTSASGEVSFTVQPVEHNVQLVLRARHHVRSAVQQVVVVPIIHVDVAPTSAGATSTTVSVSVAGAEPGDLVVVRRAGARSGQQATLNSSLAASFTVPVSQRQVIHYRVFIGRTKAHAAHSLAFYVPASGSGG